MAFANLVVKQTITNKNDVMHTTQYFAGSMFRSEVKTKDMEFISIVKGKTLTTCQKLREPGEKWNCTVGETAQIEAIMGAAKIKVRENTTKKLRKTGRFIGRSCQFYHRNMTFDVSVLGVTTSSKSSDRICVDPSLQIPVEASAYLSMDLLRGSLSKKDMKKILQEARKMNGVILYQKSEINTSSQVELVQSIAKAFGGDAKANEKSTVITKTVSINKRRLPKSLFQLPRDVDQVTDLTKN